MVDYIPSDEVNCVNQIYANHGFSGWEGWKSKCQGRMLPSLDHCFGEDEMYSGSSRGRNAAGSRIHGRSEF